MLAITENIAGASARRPAIGTLRLPLKPAHRSCVFVQGAWWPRSTELTSELPSLLAALSLRSAQSTACFITKVTGPQHPEHQTPGRPGNPLAPTKSGRTSYLYSVRGSGGWTCWWYPTHRTHARLQRGDNCGQRQRCVHTDQLLGIGTRRAGDPLLSPSRCSDGNPTEAQCQHHDPRLRCRTPEHPASRRLRGRRARYVGTGARPVTGLLLAEQSTTGKHPDALREFDP